nr:extracellular solute-binding protein [Paenibacillus bovis]
MKKFVSAFLVMVSIVLVISGCSSGEKSTKDEGEKSADQKEELTFDSSLEGEITFWNFLPDIYDGVIEEFNKVYPNIKVKNVVLEFGELHDKLQTVTSAGSGAPDVALVEQGSFPRYGNGVLEDLLQEPYNAGRYQSDTSEYNWERWKSVDGTQLLGMPWDVTPGVFYYREDLYEQHGLPSDPDELGEFLQDPENVLTAAQTFAANGIYMYEWRDSPAIQYGDAIGYYDSEYNWLRNDEKMADLLDFVKRGVQIGWAPQVSALFSDEGKQLVSQGKIASFPAGSQIARDLETLFPDQAGKWRVTRMPLDLYVGLGGSAHVIPAQSQNKDAAWAFVEWMNRSEEAWKIFTDNSIQPGWTSISTLPWYANHENEYLGGQKDYAFYDTLDEHIPVRRLTPFDGQAWEIYISHVARAIDENIDSKTTLNQIEDQAEKQIRPEINKLLESESN